MNFEALGPADHIQSAVAARLDHGYLGTSDNAVGEAGEAEAVEGGALFIAASEAVEADARDESTRVEGDDATKKNDEPGTLEEVRRLLEDREEELGLGLRLQQSRLEDDPGRTIQQLSDLHRDGLGDNTGRADYQIASEVVRELVNARLKQGNAQSEPSFGGDEDDKSLSGRTSGTDLPSSLGSGHEPRARSAVPPSILV